MKKIGLCHSVFNAGHQNLSIETIADETKKNVYVAECLLETILNEIN